MDTNDVFITILISVVIFSLAIGIITIVNYNNDIETTYIYREITVSAGDTFWKYWNDYGYYDNMNYSEALYEFKHDNDMSTSSLQAGQTVIVRKVVNRNE